jgi:hypothetical protein
MGLFSFTLKRGRGLIMHDRIRREVSEIAGLAERDGNTAENSAETGTSGSPAEAVCDTENHDERTWAKVPRLLRREMIFTPAQEREFLTACGD